MEFHSQMTLASCIPTVLLATIIGVPSTRSSTHRALANPHQHTQSGSTDLHSADPEVQRREKRVQRAGQSQGFGGKWRLWLKRGQGYDSNSSVEDKPDDLSDDTLAPDEILPFCIYHGSDLLPRLVQLKAGDYESDDVLFEALNKIASGSRRYDWSGFLIWCGLQRIVGIHYVKFELLARGYANILAKPKRPPLDESSCYRPTENNMVLNAQGAPERPTPMLNSQGLLFFLRNPSACAGSNSILQRMTHKIDGKLIRGDDACVGYGMELEVGIDAYRLEVLRFVLVLVSMCVGLIWAVKASDIQGGFAIGGCLAVLANSWANMCKGSRAESC